MRTPLFETLLLVVFVSCGIRPTLAGEPRQGEAKNLDLGNRVDLEVVYIPPGKFMMGSTHEEKSVIRT